MSDFDYDAEWYGDERWCLAFAKDAVLAYVIDGMTRQSGSLSSAEMSVILSDIERMERQRLLRAVCTEESSIAHADRIGFIRPIEFAALAAGLNADILTAELIRKHETTFFPLKRFNAWHDAALRAHEAKQVQATASLGEWLRWSARLNMPLSPALRNVHAPQQAEDIGNRNRRYWHTLLYALTLGPNGEDAATNQQAADRILDFLDTVFEKRPGGQPEEAKFWERESLSQLVAKAKTDVLGKPSRR